MTKQAFEIRRENLRRLVLEKFEGNRAALSRAAGVHQNQINLLLTDNISHQRNLGEGFARKLEEALDLQHGWLDASHDAGPTVVKQLAVLDIPSQLQHIFRRPDWVASVGVFESMLSQLGGKITSPDSLAMCNISTRDLSPEVDMGDLVVVDTAVQAVTTDGVYILVRGSDVFLRRVTRQLTGGWLISGGERNAPPAVVESLKGIKAAGKIVMVWKHIIL